MEERTISRMATLGLHHFNLRAQPELLEKLRDFYCNVVGLAVGHRPPFNIPGYWLYAGEQPVLHMSEAAAGDVRATHTATTFDHVAFNCTDRAGFEARLARLGIQYRTVRVPHTNQVQLFVRDPAGNGVELNFAGE
jgi:catechol-2,3-dioxygenase